MSHRIRTVVTLVLLGLLALAPPVMAAEKTLAQFLKSPKLEQLAYLSGLKDGLNETGALTCPPHVNLAQLLLGLQMVGDVPEWESRELLFTVGAVLGELGCQFNAPQTAEIKPNA